MIKQNKVVALSYTMKSEEGEVLEVYEREDPYVYLHGAEGGTPPGLVSFLDGKKVGDKGSVTLQAKDAFGEYDENLEITLAKSDFPEEAEIEIGSEFMGETPDGQVIVFTVTDIEGEDVAVNGNHPLAGSGVSFDVEVVSVRDATTEELSHGHAHGHDGHHHHH